MTDERQRRYGSLREQDASALREAVELLIPKSLDDLVRKARDHFQIGLATSGEMAALAAPIGFGRVRDTISGWRIVAFRDLDPTGDAQTPASVSHLSLLGDVIELGGLILTSNIAQIDLVAGLVRTRNSIYRLGARGEGEPPLEQLLFVCAMTHRWGWGHHLGIPHILY